MSDAENLCERLESLSKALEVSGRIDAHDYPDAYAIILDAIAFVHEAAVLAEQAKQEPALSRYLRYMEGHNEPDPVERLRFFCSIAMNGCDWIDSEQFFADLPPVVQQEPVGYFKQTPYSGVVQTWNKNDTQLYAAPVLQPDVVRDAMRYRWLRDKSQPNDWNKLNEAPYPNWGDIIDALIAAEKGK